MSRIRIKGLVKLASGIRHEISGPCSRQRCAEIEKMAKVTLKQVDEILHRAGTTVQELPNPSRQAYQFLTTLDFESLPNSVNPNSEGPRQGHVSFPGLRRSLKGILDQLAPIPDQGISQEVYHSICTSSAHLERQVCEDKLTPAQLTRETRDIRGWLAYFSEETHFKAYSTALAAAVPAFLQMVQNKTKLSSQIVIHFRPMQGIFRLRKYTNATLVQLPTPMICFETEMFTKLAPLIARDRSCKQEIMEAMLSDSYQEILAELELLGGITEQTGGTVYDLAESFQRVNVDYFQGAMISPRFTWSQTFTCRKFGHYDRIHDTVMVSSTLDQQKIPEYVVDFIMYHELLHKELGVVWHNGRRAVHTQKFQRDERRFARYDEARAFLKTLAIGSRVS